MKQDTTLSKHFVTGGAGFIGSHLVDRLINEDNKVTVYDNLASGRKENIKRHQGKANFNFIQGDLLDFDSLKEAMKGHEVVWHFGANSDVRRGNKDTDLDLKNGSMATRNVLEAMRQNGVGKILFSSSATVYGDVPPVAISETFGPPLPISLYGAAKLASEGLISAYCHLFNMQAWIFRFGNVLGARMRHGVVYDFIQKLRRNPKELEILGDGNQEKNYFLVEDCIDGMFFALFHSDNQCDVFNLGCESPVKVSAIAQSVAEEMGLKDVKFRYTGGKRGWPGDAPYIQFDMGKIARLGWKASHTSAEAVRIATRRLIETIKD
ncbi:NAD-dependent epimerase/dehydratase family protein [Chloroflexota bacterium]